MTVSRNIRKAVRPSGRYFTKCLNVGVLIATALIAFVDKADALVVPSQYSDGGIYFFDNDIAERLGDEKFSLLLQQHLYLGIDRDLSGYYSFGFHYPCWQYADFKEGDNVEWIYSSLENQYSFLDDALYKLSGGNYFLGSVWAPSWHGFDDVYWAAGIKRYLSGIQRKKLRIVTIGSDESDIVKSARTNIEVAASSGETYRPGNLSAAYMEDTVSGGMSNQIQILNVNPVFTNNGGTITQDMATIPEPSGIMLFGLVGLSILVRRRKV